jgi:hypothetical protein
VDRVPGNSFGHRVSIYSFGHRVPVYYFGHRVPTFPTLSSLLSLYYAFPMHAWSIETLPKFMVRQTLPCSEPSRTWYWTAEIHGQRLMVGQGHKVSPYPVHILLTPVGSGLYALESTILSVLSRARFRSHAPVAFHGSSNTFAYAIKTRFICAIQKLDACIIDLDCSRSGFISTTRISNSHARDPFAAPAFSFC